MSFALSIPEILMEPGSMINWLTFQLVRRFLEDKSFRSRNLHFMFVISSGSSMLRNWHISWKFESSFQHTEGLQCLGFLRAENSTEGTAVQAGGSQERGPTLGLHWLGNPSAVSDFLHSLIALACALFILFYYIEEEGFHMPTYISEGQKKILNVLH